MIPAYQLHFEFVTSLPVWYKTLQLYQY